MTKIAKIESVAFGEKNLGAKARKHTTVSNEGTETLEITSIAINNDVFTLDAFAETLLAKLPKSSTIYLDEDGFIQNASGEYYTTWQGYGAFCTTDALGIPTIGFTTSYVEIDSVNNGVNMELVGMYVENMKYFFGTNGKIVDKDDASATEIFYGIGNSDKMIDVNIDTMEVTITTPVLTAGVEGNIVGTHNGGSGWLVDVYYRKSSLSAWNEFEFDVTVEADNSFSATGTLADADTYDFLVMDSNVDAILVQDDDVVVASGTVVPTTDEYSSFILTILSPGTSGDVFQSKADADIIVLLKLGADTKTYFHNVDTDAETQTIFQCTNANAYCEPWGEALNTTDSIGGLNYAKNHTLQFKYNANAAVISSTATGTENICGGVETNAGLRFLLDDGKLYSTVNYTDFTMETDLSSIIPASASFKPCAYNATDNYLYVLDIGTNKLYTIDLDTNTKIGEITPTDTLKGIVYHKGRITYAYTYTDGAPKLKTVVLKNSDD